MREIIVDNFAGGGGASTGIELAIGRSVDNHIASAKNGLPEGWQDWAEEIESDLRRMASPPGEK